MVERCCPRCRCHTQLHEVDFDGQRVDRCKCCHGIYFDAGELEAISSMVELYAEVQLDEPEIDHVPGFEREHEMLCPAEGSAMEHRNIGGVWVDLCPDCHGIWVDGGEITALRIAENQIRANLTLYLRLGS